MVRLVSLRFELDSRPMQAGAAAAEKAVHSLQVEVNRSADELEALERIFKEATDRGIKPFATSVDVLGREINTLSGQMGRIIDHMQRADAEARRLAEENRQLAERTRTVGAEIHKTTSIMDVAERKFATLGKAAVGMFAADIVAKVAGFTSAMDLLGKSSEFVANKIKESFGIDDRIRSIERHREAVEKTSEAYKSLADELEKIARSDDSLTRFGIKPEGANLGYRPPGGMYELGLGRFAPQGRTFDIGGLDPGQAEVAKYLIEDINSTYRRILSGDLDAEYKGGGILQGEAFSGAGITAAFDRLTQSIQDRIDAMRTALTVPVGSDEWFVQRNAGGQFLGPGYTSIAASGVGSDEWFAREARMARAGYRPDLSGFYAGNSDVSRRSQLAMESIARNRERSAALNTSELARLNGYGGITDLPSEYFPVMGDVPAPFFERFPAPKEGRERKETWLYGENEGRFDGGYIGRLNNRYTPEAIAEQFSSNLYQSMEYSLLSGDFSNFGRSVVSMIGQSLMENLVAAPFQEAMAVLMQQLLTSIRGGGGVAGAAPAIGNGSGSAYTPPGGHPGAPMGLQAGGRSNSVAPYRSAKQALDDLNRGRI